MKKILSLIISVLLTSLMVNAAQWVVYDDFNGTSLDSTLWLNQTIASFEIGSSYIEFNGVNNGCISGVVYGCLISKTFWNLTTNNVTAIRVRLSNSGTGNAILQDLGTGAYCSGGSGQRTNGDFFSFSDVGNMDAKQVNICTNITTIISPTPYTLANWYWIEWAINGTYFTTTWYNDTGGEVGAILKTGYSSNFTPPQFVNISFADYQGDADKIRIEVVEYYDNYTEVFDTCSFVAPTPSNNSHNNTQVIINMSCDVASSNYTLWLDNTTATTPFVFQGTNNTWLTNMSLNDDYNYRCTCEKAGYTPINSSIYKWYFDNETPTIIINELSYINDILTQNYTLTDNIGLYAYSIEVRDSVGTNFFNETNTTLNAPLKINYSNSLNVSNWTTGIYTFNITTSDIHTTNNILDYSITNDKNAINFYTPEKNIITIIADNSTSINAIKQVDKYSLVFNYDEKDVSTTRTFYVLGYNNKITYYPNSPYKAHFVIFNDELFSGNWIDFEGINGIPIVKRINDNEYQIIFNDVKGSIIAESIGGLNIVSVEQDLLIGNTAPIITTTYPTGQETCLYNLTCFNFTVVDDITEVMNCTLILNEATNDTIIANNNTLTSLCVSSIDGGDYNWSINCTDGDLNNVSDTLLSSVESCKPDWNDIIYSDCNTSDEMIKTYLDINNCNNTCLLPNDNGTEIECNYCSEDLFNITSECTRLTTNYSVTWYDNNYYNCCYATGLLSDCSILYPPYNEPTWYNCTEDNITSNSCQENLTNDFNCSYDANPVLNKKMNVVCVMPDNESYECVVNTYQNNNLLGTTPEYREASNSLFNFKGEGDTRTYFTPRLRLVNAFYTDKSLRTDTAFTMEVFCSSATNTIKSQYCITPEYERPDWIANRLVWAKNNMVFILLILCGVVLILGIIVYYIRKM